MLNDRYDHRKHKINAKANAEEYQNCLHQCEEICKKKESKIEEKTSVNIYLSGQDSHFYKYIVGDEPSKEINKENLFERQYDLVYKKK